MGFLIDALDGDSSTVSPPSLPALSEAVDELLIREAEEFLCRTSLPIEPRKKWPAGGMPQYGIHTASTIRIKHNPAKHYAFGVMPAGAVWFDRANTTMAAFPTSL
jgi:ATP-dependent DNA helicase RecQ